MSPTEAQSILLSWRPGHGDLRDPEVGAALEVARNDPALSRWLEKHSDFQRAMAKGFQAIPVPADLRSRIIHARPRIIEPDRWWRSPAWLSAAAAVVLLLGVAAWWVRPPAENSLSVFRSRMVGAVLRQYTMDIVTNDMVQIRAHLAGQQAPSDYVLPEKLTRLPVTGSRRISGAANV